MFHHAVMQLVVLGTLSLGSSVVHALTLSKLLLSSRVTTLSRLAIGQFPQAAATTKTMTIRRSSSRLRGLSPAPAHQNPNEEESSRSKPPKRSKSTLSSKNKKKMTPSSGEEPATTKKKARRTKSPSAANKQEEQSLPRDHEEAILEKLGASTVVMGIDEAGRGPLAGPVVAAAAFVPAHVEGICDSKKVTKEEHRQELFDRLVASPGILWAAAVMDAPYIDQVNILQATLHGMTLTAQAVIHMHKYADASLQAPPPPLPHIQTKVTYHNKASSSLHGCYLVTSEPFASSEPSRVDSAAATLDESEETVEQESGYYALIDGNRLPKHMPCGAETITKGDGREYSIAAASIVAKVVRDNLMREYHDLYPAYNLQQHKGYPTAAHMALVRDIGVTPIHRRTFAPLKTMEFDNNGNVIPTNNNKDG